MTTFMSIHFPKRLNLLRPWLTTSGIAMLYAEAGVGKTRLALSIGYAVASEQSLMDWQCEQRAKVLLVDGEMPGELLQQWIDTLGPTLPDEDFQILSHAHLDTLNKTMPDLGQEAGREFLD
jgi:AAA domain